MTTPELAALDIPEGFKPLRSGPGYIAANGPLYLRRMPDHVLLGLRVQARHCNPMNNLHGGMMATFADMLLPVAANHQTEITGRFFPTISLQIDFVAPVPLGAWIEGRADILRTTRSMVFAQGLVHADGKLAARISGILKIGPEFKHDWKHPPDAAAS